MSATFATACIIAAIVALVLGVILAGASIVRAIMIVLGVTPRYMLRRKP